MAILPVPLPITTPIANPRNTKKYREGQKDPKEGLLPDPWVNFMVSQTEAIANSTQRLFMVALVDQGATIGATDISNGALTAGLYSFRYYARITRPGSISSSLQITLDWRDGGVTVAISGAAITGNLTTSFQDATHLIHVDGASPVRYTATYASAGGTSMQFALYLVLERVNA